MQKKQGLKNDLLVMLIIGMSFLMVGAEYITWWLYGLVPRTSAGAADILSEGIGYLFQVLGMCLFAFLIRKKKSLLTQKLWLPVILLADFLFTLAGYLASTLTLVILLGFIMNFLHGVVIGYYLTRLAEYGDKRHTGLIFGIGYAFGSVGTYVLSSVFSGSLGSPYIFVLYFLMGVCVILLDVFLRRQEKVTAREEMALRSEPFTAKQLGMVALVVFLFSFVKNIGFYFPSSSYISGAVDPVLVRCAYAVGLAVAGYINDKSRRYGSICCICALIFPFLVLVLNGMEGAEVIAWILGYVFFGFFSVYRVVVFTDQAQTDANLMYLAGFGMLFGRIGDASSSILGICIGGQSNLILLIATILFIVTVFVYFRFYNQVYVTVIPKAQNPEDVFAAFLKSYEISIREKEVLLFVLEGLSNSEIAEKLYISESTVKFHIHNILKKTQATNRAELIKCYEQFQQR